MEIGDQRFSLFRLGAVIVKWFFFSFLLTQFSIYALDLAANCWLSHEIFFLDGSKNEVSHPAVKIMGYPTIYLFPAADKQNPIEYDGERTADAIIDFINNFRSIGGTSERESNEYQSVELVDNTATENTEINDINIVGNKGEL